MTKFEVIEYETEDGDNPVEKFLDKLNPKMRAKICQEDTKNTCSRNTISKSATRRLYGKDEEGMKTLNEMLEKQMNDENFRKEYEEMQPEFDVIRAIVGARTSQNLTQKELAERTGIDQADISKLENGTRNPSVNLLKRLAEGMGMVLKIEFVPKQKA